MLRPSHFETSRTDLTLDPIEPSWIESGCPVARSVTLSRSGDASLSTGLWDCTAGRFKWIFRFDEIAHILEGEVIVTEGTTTYRLVPGSVMHFPRGLETHWEVPRYVKKAFTLRAPHRSLLRRAASSMKQQLLALKRRRHGLSAVTECLLAAVWAGALG